MPGRLTVEPIAYFLDEPPDPPEQVHLNGRMMLDRLEAHRCF